ncbi:MAG: hypothetical protein V7K63_20705 [Nostoc sp.]
MNQAIDATKDTLRGLVKNPHINQIMGVSFGGNYNHFVADNLLNNLAEHNFSEAPNVVLVSGQVNWSE